MGQERLKQAIENNRKDSTTGHPDYKFVPKQPEIVPTNDKLTEAWEEYYLK